MNAFSAPHCTLCDAMSTHYCEDSARGYFQCRRCELVFVHPRYLLSREQEARYYDLHQNAPDDPRYRRFLSRLFEPLNARLHAGSRGLDFGSGPGPTLSKMFVEAGHRMEIYDPIYAPNAGVLAVKYDFVTASEVVEHFHNPNAEFRKLWSLLSPGGWLGVMTKRVRNAKAFRNWHYIHDPTHVSFFSLRTFQWLAEQFGAELVIAGDDVVLLRRSNDD